MKVAEIQFAPWDKKYFFSCEDINLAVRNKVIVKTELGIEIGEVANLIELEADKVEKGIDLATIKPVVRKATESDLDKLPSDKEQIKALEMCKQFKQKHNLAMKFVDTHYSYDGSRITFAFIADGRIDFRELVKDLTRHFGKTIRLQQIGIRDEARHMGDFGHCGRELCCKSHLKELCSIVSDMAELQQCSHRGSDRISGVCGRLMCCLAYEQKDYEALSKKMPPIGARVNVDGKRGEVVSHHTLRQAVSVKFVDKKGGYTIAEVDLNRNKKKKDCKDCK